MSNVREHSILDAQLEEVLGAEPAAILMSHIPADSDIATRSGLDALGDRLDLRIERLDTRMDGFDARMDRLDAHMVRLDDSSTDSMERYETRHEPASSR